MTDMISAKTILSLAVLAVLGAGAAQACCCGSAGPCPERALYRGEERLAMADKEPAPAASSAAPAEESAAMDAKKLSAVLKTRLAAEPLCAENADKPLRVTVKTTDRGQELRRFLEEQGGRVGSAHGAIITAEVRYGSLPGLSRLASVTYIEGEWILSPAK